MDGPPLQVVPLSRDLLDAAAALVAQYTREDGASAQDVQACRAVVERHLRAAGSQIFLAGLAPTAWAGFIHIAWTLSTSRGLPVRRIQGLYTAPESRRRGVATALLQHAERLARARGASRLQLAADAGNRPARRLYQRFGFEILPHKQMYMKFL